MKYLSILIIVLILAGGLGYFLFTSKKDSAILTPPPTVTKQTEKAASSPTPTPTPDAKSGVTAFLANKYQKPISEVNVTIDKEVTGFASGSVLFGEGGPGEGGMWLAVLGNSWEVVWDGNGNVDCNKMRQNYGFPDTILKPDFCI